MIRRLGIVALLVLVWIGLWGDPSVPNLVGGVLVAVAAQVLVPLDRPEVRGRFRPLAAARFGLYFIWQLLVANVEVGWEVVTPRNRDNEGIVAVPVPASCSPTVMMVIVNAIGLTPGTVVVEIAADRRRIFVHVLHLDDVSDARHDLLELEERIIDAFGSSEARDELAALLRAEGMVR